MLNTEIFILRFIEIYLLLGISRVVDYILTAFDHWEPQRDTHTHTLSLSLSLSSLLPFREQPIILCMNVKGERVSLPVVPMRYRILSGDAEKAHVGVHQLLLAGWLAMVCVCVCVCVRERERERKRVVFRVDLFKAWAPALSFDSPFKMQRVSVYWVPFQVHICF